MTSRFRLFVLALSTAAVSMTGAPRAAAQTTPAADPAEHPAAKVVKEYLAMIITRQWKKSADIVDEKSMEVLHNDYVARTEKARTMDEEESMIRRVGKSTIKEVAAMKPREFYTAFHEGLQVSYKVEDAKLDVIRKTITMKVLSVVEETERLAHVLVRAKYSTGEADIERLELVSLLKNGGKWQVALNEQAPKAKRLDGAEGPGKGADPAKPAGPADPVTPVKPSVDPVKPAKPAAKPPVKPKTR